MYTKNIDRHNVIQVPADTYVSYAVKSPSYVCVDEN